MADPAMCGTAAAATPQARAQARPVCLGFKGRLPVCAHTLGGAYK